MHPNQRQERRPVANLKWRAVWVHVDCPQFDPIVLSDALQEVGRSLGLKDVTVEFCQGHVLVEFELDPSIEGEQIGRRLKAKSNELLTARYGAVPGGWWGRGFFATRL